MSMSLLSVKARGRLGVALVLAVFCGAAAPAFAQPVADASAPAKTSAKLTGLVFAMATGSPYINAKDGLYCIAPVFNQTYNGVRQTASLGAFIGVFKSEIEGAGYRAISEEDNLFGQEDGASDYQVAAVVTELHYNLCVYTSSQAVFGHTMGEARGDVSMTIEWQVYSPLKKQVVARITTSGTAKLEKSVPDAVTQLGVNAFGVNAHALAANAEFLAAMNATRPAPNELLKPSQNGPIALSGSLKAAKHSIADAVGSVVTLETGSGSGSAVLVSDDGYMITDAHVVGDEKEIRVRWSDGIENVGQVIRVAKDRDVALIKTSARDRSPLPLKRGAVTPGQRVFAIGSPKGKDFQGTVSSGVVSAERTIRGLRYIQSDVSVSFGSSGGPLLDADGSVIGFTDLGIPNAGQPAGLNLFTPIGDAMDFLNLEQH
jgi:serine protease Do